MSTDRESGRGNKRARVTRGSRKRKKKKKKAKKKKNVPTTMKF
jgi:hypothetical protein